MGMMTGSISPAFEWAQSGDWVYINAKMSHKLDAPATLNVVSEGVKMDERSLKFAASKDHKRFSLDLTLHADIDPDVSERGRGRHIHTYMSICSYSERFEIDVSSDVTQAGQLSFSVAAVVVRFSAFPLIGLSVAGLVPCSWTTLLFFCPVLDDP